MAEGAESVQAGAPSDEAGAETADSEGWPVLSDLELDVCVSESTVALPPFGRSML